MAKKNLGRLAGLAALAGAAYMASKGKDKDDAGDQKTSSYTGDTKKVEDKEEPRRQITDYMKKSDGDSKPITEADVVMPEKAAPKTATAPRTSTTAKTAPRGDSSRVNLEAGMSRGTRSVPNNNYSNEGRSSAKPPSTMSSSAEGMKNYKPRRAPAAAPFKGGQPGYDEAGNFLGGRRGYDEAGNPMKKGGKVKKMASGGMTVSKRADGIASRGKTKCKMY
jgi:hypothetical protein